MAIIHLNDVHFTPAEMGIINTNWAAIMQVLEAKKKNLSAGDRQKFGSVAEKNKLVVLKTLEYDEHQPQLNSPDVDYAELKADWADRSFIAGFMGNMATANIICDNIRITHDYDAYQAARSDYNYTKYKMEAGDAGAGWEAKYNDLLPFFKTNDGSGGGGASDTPTPPNS